MSENVARASDAIRVFERLESMGPETTEARNLNASSFMVPATPLRLPNPLTRGNRADGLSRSHLYSQTVSHIVDTGPVREVFHLSPSTARMAIDSKWHSIDEEDERSHEVDQSRHSSPPQIQDASSLSRQPSFSLTPDPTDPLGHKVELI